MNQKQGKTSLNYSHVKIIKIPQEVIKNKDSLITLDISGSNFKNFSSIIEDLKNDANFKLKVHDFSISDVSDLTYVNAVLEEKGFSLSSNFTALYKINFDYDGDSEEEEFYVMSNVFPTDFIPDYLFSIVFMVKNNEIYYIYDDVSKNTGYNGCKPYFTSFLDTNNDGISEFILSCARYGNSTKVDMLYQFNKEKDGFKILISNQ